jgi:hypothetical protein
MPKFQTLAIFFKKIKFHFAAKQFKSETPQSITYSKNSITKIFHFTSDAKIFTSSILPISTSLAPTAVKVIFSKIKFLDQFLAKSDLNN